MSSTSCNYSLNNRFLYQQKICSESLHDVNQRRPTCGLLGSWPDGMFLSRTIRNTQTKYPCGGLLVCTGLATASGTRGNLTNGATRMKTEWYISVLVPVYQLREFQRRSLTHRFVDCRHSKTYVYDTATVPRRCIGADMLTLLEKVGLVGNRAMEVS